jgi:hypothetical protein
MLPILEQGDNFLYFDCRGNLKTKITIDSAKNSNSQEGNFGVGYRRHFYKNTINIIGGIYLFYDIKNTNNNNLMHQITSGFEALNPFWELRINTYLPFSKHKYYVPTSVAHHITHDEKNIYVGQTGNIERSLKGFDTEVGIKIPRLNASSYLGYYAFFGTNISKIHGLKFRLEYQALQWLIVNGEYQTYKNTWYLGLTSRISITKNKTQFLSIVKNKINTPPVRDIDIFIIEQNTTQNLKLATLVTTAAELELALQNNSQEIVIANNIDLGGMIIHKNSNVNTRISGINLTRQNGKIISAIISPVTITNTIHTAGQVYLSSSDAFPFLSNTTNNIIRTNPRNSYSYYLAFDGSIIDQSTFIGEIIIQ